MKIDYLIKLLAVWIGLFTVVTVYASAPILVFQPLTPTAVTVPFLDKVTVKYLVTNKSRRKRAFVMHPIAAVTQITEDGNCPSRFVLGHHESCVLNLSIDGSLLIADINGGPVVCLAHNQYKCYRPGSNNILKITKGTGLVASVSDLALSVKGLTEFGVSGTDCTQSAGTQCSGVSRMITIQNVSNSDAYGLTVSMPSWPAGTTSSTTCGNLLAAGASCTVSINPGYVPTSDSNNNPCSVNATAPVPGVVQVSSSIGENNVSANVVVLSYGCVFNGGYVYAVDDTPPTDVSIKGKVLTSANQNANPIVWSFNAVANEVDFTDISGIYETSTTPCVGNADGFCDSTNILNYYTPTSTYPLNSYAAGLCTTTINNYSDWYLPAICELGYDTNSDGTGCGTAEVPTYQNAQSNLVDYNNLNLLSSSYWSSTEYSIIPQGHAWFQTFSSQQGGSQYYILKNFVRNVRCARAF